MADKNPIRGFGSMLDELSGRGVDKLTAFVGKRITRVLMSSGDIAFELDDGTTIIADPEGDCCSTTWVEHVSGVSDAYGAQIVSVNLRPELSTQEDVDDSNYECLALYGISLITDGGARIDIDYRNASNGYYGGWLNWTRVDEALSGDWAEIREDF